MGFGVMWSSIVRTKLVCTMEDLQNFLIRFSPILYAIELSMVKSLQARFFLPTIITRQSEVQTFPKPNGY